MTAAIVKAPSAVPVTFTDEQIDLLKNTIAKGTSDDELRLFIAVANRLGLDPFARQICAVMRWSKSEGRKAMTIQTTIDGFRVIAERTGQYRGQQDLQWCGPDGVWQEVWLKKEPPAAARASVLRSGFTLPLTRVATFDSYAQYNKDGQLAGLWAQMPDLMLGKCAEALALRAAFPNDLGGVYTDDELGQADNEQPRGLTASSHREDPDVIDGVSRDVTRKADALAQREAWEAGGDLAGLVSEWPEDRCEQWIRVNGWALINMHHPHADYCQRRVRKAGERFGWSRDHISDLMHDRNADKNGNGIPDSFDALFLELDTIASSDALRDWCRDYAADLSTLEGAAKKAAWRKIKERARSVGVVDDDVKAWLAPPPPDVAESDPEPPVESA